MGLNAASIKYLELMREKFDVNFESIAMLGRQDLVMSDKALKDFCDLIGYGGSIDKLRRRDGFSENLLSEIFQSKSIESFDYSDYENGTHILDLNVPVPDEYEERYTVVLDGGTLEHIFNFPVALQSAMRMCVKGGSLILMTPTNNYNGHGFYQFSPDLFFDVLSNNGFCIQDVSYVEELGNESYMSYKTERGVPDYKLIANRRACLFVCARKISDTPAALTAQQSIWQGQWTNAGIDMREKGDLIFYDLAREIANNQDNCHTYKGAKYKGKKILFYGAGKVCRLFMDESGLDFSDIEIVGIADRRGSEIEIKGFLVERFDFFKRDDFDYIVITTGNDLAEEIKKEIGDLYGYSDEIILSLPEFLYYMRPCIY